MFKERARNIAHIEVKSDEPMDDLMHDSEVKLNRKVVKTKLDRVPQELLLGFEHNTAHANKKRRKLAELGLKERVAIVKKAISR